MPIDFNKPVSTDRFHDQVLPGIKDAISALAQLLDPAVAGTLTDPPVGAIQLDSANSGAVKRFNGTTFDPQAVNGISWTGAAAVVGASTAYPFAVGASAITPTLQAQGASAGGSSLGLARWAASAAGPSLYMGHSRGAVIGTHALVVDDDPLGDIVFDGSDGAAFVEAARLRAAVDGVAAGGNVPGRLEFYTRALGDAAVGLALTLNGDKSALFAGSARVGGAVYGTLGVRSGGAYGGTGANSNVDDFVIEANGNAGLTILTPATGVAQVRFGDPDHNAVGGFNYAHSTDVLSISAGGVTQLTLDQPNGAATFAGDITTPRVRVTSATDASATSTGHGFQVGADGGPNVIIDTNEILARDNGAMANLALNAGGSVSIGSGGLSVTGGGLSVSAGGITVVGGGTIDGIQIGYRNMPRLATAGGTPTTNGIGKCYSVTGNCTIPANEFAEGDGFAIWNRAATAITITRGASLTLYNVANSTNTASFSLPAKSMATFWYDSTTVCTFSSAQVS